MKVGRKHSHVTQTRSTWYDEYKLCELVHGLAQHCCVRKGPVIIDLMNATFRVLDLRALR